MEPNRIELQWKKIYRIGAICVFSATLVMITEMLLTAHPEGASHTPGTFPGFFLGGLTSILFCVIMLKGKVFKRIISVAGLAGFSIMLVFEIFSSFIPSLSGMAMIIAMVGGILIIAWFIMVGIKLWADSVSK